MGHYQSRGSFIGVDRGSYRASYPSFSTTASSDAGTLLEELIDETKRDRPWTVERERVSRKNNGSLGSTGAVTLERIDSVPIEMSQKAHRPFGSLGEPKVFALVPPSNAGNDQASYVPLVICVADTHSEKLLCLDLRLEARSSPGEALRQGRRRHRSVSKSHGGGVIVKLKGVRRQADVVDALKLVDKSCARLLALQRTKEGLCLYVLPGPSYDWIKVSFPQQLKLADSRRLGIPEPWVKRDKLNQRHPVQHSSLNPTALIPVSAQGMVGLFDQAKKTHLFRIQLCPRHHQVATMLDLCRWVLPEDNAGEGVTIAWWEIMQWLESRSESSLDREWTALIIALMSLAMPFLDGPRQAHSPKRIKSSTKARKASGGTGYPTDHWTVMLDQESSNLPNPMWTLIPAWDWCLELEREPTESYPENNSYPTRRASNLTRTGLQSVQPASVWKKNSLLIDCASLTREFILSAHGSNATGDHGYLPTARGRHKELQRTALATVVVALHLYREELRLNITYSEADEVGMSRLTAIVAQLGSWLGWESWSWRGSGYYCTEDVNMDKWLFDEG